MNTKLKCLLLDDELPGLTYLKMLCEQLPEVEVVKAFDNPAKLLEELPKLDFDCCILDIDMPGMNGLQIANLLSGKPVIFATAYKEFAADAFDLNAVDYIRKPIKLERLQQAVSKCTRWLETLNRKQAKKFIQLNTDKGKTLLYFDRLGLITTSPIDSRDKIGVLLDGTQLTFKNISFEKLLELLPEEMFCRVNKREIVSLQAIHVFSYDEITTNIPNGKGKMYTLNLSEVFRSEFIKKLNP